MSKRVLIILLSIVFLFSCKDDSTSPVTTEDDLDLLDDLIFVEGTLNQVGGCRNDFLGKSSNRDSIFNYSFSDSLEVDFCLFSNCCPDTSRFELNYRMEGDTIIVEADDISEHSCNCDCKYIIHTNFKHLFMDTLFFRVEFAKYALYGDTNKVTVYDEKLIKNH